MSLTSYRAAPPRDPKDGVYNALSSAARKCFCKKTFNKVWLAGLRWSSGAKKREKAIGAGGVGKDRSV
jgi:hypothetical protein